MNTAVLADTNDTGLFIEKKEGDWQSIKTAPQDGTVIDLWLDINPSPLSMGMGDSFGVPDAWFENGKWVHMYRGKPTELDRHYIKHWRSRAAA